LRDLVPGHARHPNINDGNIGLPKLRPFDAASTVVAQVDLVLRKGQKLANQFRRIAVVGAN
jgi:hypothetical protein